MSELRKQDQAAIEVVARHFSAKWEKGDGDSPDAYVTIAGKRIAVEVTAIKQRIAERGNLARPRLRFDRVALGLVGGLQAALREFVPDGEAVVLTITAPIRLPSRTAAALEDKIRVCLARRSAQLEVKDTIHGNQIRVRLVKGVSRRVSKVIGFVHNPDSDPDVLLHVTQSLLQNIGAAADKRPPEKFTGDRWLVVANKDGLSYIETYRHVYSQLSISTDFKKILMVLAGGRVETLTG
ncbi:hypothetical protein SAMN05444161_6469 [Rhizobiales bacterium GAS191]|jgi:hypothetical protein|nr:hypothetical protein SAMN05519103_05639 [Rhizobiales bacterium GAS113]SED85851.1 hypothetical protein SAMN05519104_4568 [Rhizobiales bacterium GAS188]SEE63631.1 hypothetical protein SAMN05444161_6469 [Rhizobiales bacterium GAS191]